jgi:hypothetical protein
MNSPYGDTPTPARRPLNTQLPPDTPCCRCKQPARLYRVNNGFVVGCTDPYCPLDELPLANNEACPSRAAAVKYWIWKRTGRIQ